VYAYLGILYYFSSTANPILYNLMSRKFRAAFRRTVFCWCRCESCGGATNARLPLPPAVPPPVPVVHDGHRRALPRRPANNALVLANNILEAVDTSANDRLPSQEQVLTRYTGVFRASYF